VIVGLEDMKNEYFKGPQLLSEVLSACRKIRQAARASKKVEEQGM